LVGGGEKIQGRGICRKREGANGPCPKLNPLSASVSIHCNGERKGLKRGKGRQKIIEGQNNEGGTGRKTG